MKTKKKDNSDVVAKLMLRRHFLDAYGGPHHVMDCCEGDGVLWRTLRREYDVASYFGMDRRKTTGRRLKIDSSRVLTQSGWTQNVIDIDTYGSPWKHWIALLPNVSRTTTVFLTYGVAGLKVGGAQFPNEIWKAMNVPIEFAKLIPAPIKRMLVPQAVDAVLGLAHEHVQVIECAEAATSYQAARYFGVRIAPKEPPTNSE